MDGGTRGGHEEAPPRGLRGECLGRGRGAVPGVPSIVCPPLALSLPCDLGQCGACLLPLLASRLGVFRVGWVSPFSSQEKQGGLGVRSIMMNGWWASFSHAGDNSQGIIENEDEETPIPE